MTNDPKKTATGSTGRETDAETGTATTGHEWDGIKELDTPLPRWWLWTFYATIVWAFGYVIAYPAIPLINQATQGVLGYSTRSEFERTVAAHEAANADVLARVAAADFGQIGADPDLDAFARAGGAALFRTNCSQCHGAGAAGASGYPNLLDDEWLWGGTEEAIYTTLQHGIRWEDDPDTRYSEMPNFGADGILTRPQMEALADHVLSLSGQAEPNAEGAELFADNCAACHGENGEGLQDMGAPNLADAIWLYGGTRESILTQLTRARHGVMPAWSSRLNEAELKQLAHYVHGLGGGE